MEQIINKITNCDNPEDIRELWGLIGKYHFEHNQTAHNLIIGIPSAGDTVLFSQLISTDNKLFGWREEVLSYPPKAPNYMKRAIISSIAIIDGKNDWTGGEASILSGGIGSESVEIKLESQFSRGFSFCVIIIGKYFDYLDNNSSKLTFNHMD